MSTFILITPLLTAVWISSVMEDGELEVSRNKGRILALILTAWVSTHEGKWSHEACIDELARVLENVGYAGSFPLEMSNKYAC